MISFLSKHKYWIFIAIVFLFLRLPSLFEPYWYGDEGIYLTLGQGIRKGLILYKQIHDNKPPTLYYFAALSRTVFGFRLLLLLVMIPTIYFFYRLALFFLKSPLAKFSTLIFVILTSLPFIEGNIANAEMFMLLPTIVGFYFFITAKKNVHYLLSGLFLGIAFTIKIPVFIEVVFLICWIFIKDFSSITKKFKQMFFKAFLLGIGFLIPTLMFLFYFYQLKAFQPFLNSALLQNFSYLSSWATGTQTASASSGGLITRLVILFLFWLIIFVIHQKKIISSSLGFLLIWLSATVFGALLSTRPYPHYLIQIVPPLCILFVFLFLRKSIKNIFFILLSFFFIGLLIIKYNFYFYPSISYYYNFYSLKKTVDFYQYFGSKVNTNYQISEFIRNNTSLSDSIFVWGDEPYIYALSNRLPSSRYTVAYHIVDFNGYQETIEAFKANLPKFVIYYPMDQRSFSQLDSFLDRYYFLDRIFDSILIFQKR